MVSCETLEWVTSPLKLLRELDSLVRDSVARSGHTLVSGPHLAKNRLHAIQGTEPHTFLVAGQPYVRWYWLAAYEEEALPKPKV
jgi:hypothetical protein